MNKIFKQIVIIVLVTVIGFSMAACDNADGGDTGGGGSGVVPPGDKSEKDRWGKYVAEDSTATLAYSVDNNGVCTITVGGKAQPNNESDGWGIWKASAQYTYTPKANTRYAYKFEAWTESGNRTLRFQYCNDIEKGIWLSEIVSLTNERKTYTVYGQPLSEGTFKCVEFQCANQTGKFYVKMLEIKEYNGGSGDGKYDYLSGDITISPTDYPTLGMELTAIYDGDESVTFYWQRFYGYENISDVGTPSTTNPNKFTPTEIGDYIVEVRAEGYYPRSKQFWVTLPDLLGDITISPNGTVEINTELTATYSGSETVSYQWNNYGTAINGETSKKFTPTETGSYTVTVSATNYNSKTSENVYVHDSSLPTLSGDITISPNSGVTTYTELTATYSGSEYFYSWEDRYYYWEKDGISVGIDSRYFTPTEAGSYTVTFSVVGYNPKTSAAVNVTLSDLSGDITISPSTNVYIDMELTAFFSGGQNVTYQWKKDGSNVGTNDIYFTPTEAGSYTVTVSAVGYNDKTSPAVTVEPLHDLSGSITINPSGTVAVNTQLTATYNGSETVSYQWKNGSSNVGTNSNKYMPTTPGSFTVTVSATGYNSKTSNIVTISATQLIDNTWADGNLPKSSDVQWFKFTATENKQYIHVNFYSLDDLYVQVYDSSGVTVGSETNLSNLNIYTKYISRMVMVGHEYYIKVRPYGSRSGTYQIAFNTSETTPTSPDLSGNITISPSGTVTTFTELTATYSGSETVTYQWKKGGSNVGTNSNKYTPTEAGNYTVTVSVYSYNPKTSDIVFVVLSDLSGNITISPSGKVFINTQLTATYSGSETVTYQWIRGGSYVGSNSNKFSPYEEGSYTVTVSAQGYNSKTSAPVTLIKWKEVSNNTFGISNIRAIAYGNGKFVAGGYDGKMATSTNGTTWTAVTQNIFNPRYDYIEAIAYGNGKFIAGGSNGKMATSTDGTTWTAVNTTNFTDVYGDGDIFATIDGIAYGNNMFVAFASYGGAYSKIVISTDGTTWTVVMQNLFGSNPFDHISTIVYVNNMFIAGGSDSKMATSTDGVTWTAIPNSTFGTSTVGAIVYANNKFVAGGGGSGGKMATSIDGVTWTAVTDSTFGTSGILAIAYGNNKFIAGGSDGKMATSTDGVTWTAIPNSTFGSDIIYEIVYGNNKFIAVGSYGRIAYLDD